MQLCEQEGVTIAQVAHELGIDVKLLYRWRTEHQRQGNSAFPGQGNVAADENEVRRLQRELARVQLERDILKMRWASRRVATTVSARNRQVSEVSRTSVC
jgi:transposase